MQRSHLCLRLRPALEGPCGTARPAGEARAAVQEVPSAGSLAPPDSAGGRWRRLELCPEPGGGSCLSPAP